MDLSPGGSQATGNELLCSLTGGTLSKEKDKSLIANLQLPQFTSELEEAGHSEDDHVVSTVMGSKPQNEENTVFILGDTFPVVPAKLVKWILKGGFVDMAELLKDNMEAERRRLTCAEGVSSTSPQRELPDLSSWLYYYSLFAVIVCSKHPEKSQEMWAYQTMLIGEARRCVAMAGTCMIQLFSNRCHLYGRQIFQS